MTTMSPRNWIDLTALALIWGATFMFTAIALKELGPLTAVAFRVSIGTAVLWALVWWRGLVPPRRAGLWAALAVMGLLNNLLPFSLITWGQVSIASGLASILNASTGVFGMLVAALFLADERLTARRVLGAVIAFGGVVVTMGPASLAQFDITALGQIAVLGAALSYALAGVWARRHLAGLPPLLAAAGMTLCAALMLWPLAIAAEGVPDMSYSATTWGALAYQGAVATALAYLLYYRILASAGSGNLMLVTLLLPVVALVLGWMVLSEPLIPRHLAGFGLVALGLVVLSRRARPAAAGTRLPLSKGGTNG